MNTPMLKANQVLIDFDLTDENIENYRQTFDSTTVLIVYTEDDEAYSYIGGDLCDMLYQVRDEVEEIVDMYYCDKYEVKNYDDPLNLIAAAFEAYAGCSTRIADEIEKAIVCLEDDICFIMEYNNFEDEIDKDEFDKLWNNI